MRTRSSRRRKLEQPLQAAPHPSQQRSTNPHAILSLQRSLGNRATTSLIRSRSNRIQRLFIQRTLASTLQELLTADTINHEAIRTAVKDASAEERALVSANSGLIKLAETKLTEKNYPEFLHALHVHEPMSTAQLSGYGSPDLAAIGVQAELVTLLGESIREDSLGRINIAERMLILPTSTFVSVALRYFPQRKPEDFNTVSGFNEDGKIFIDAGKTTDIGTMIHESIHLFAPNIFGNTLGNDMNEGTTEYFARSIINKLGLSISRTKYQDEYRHVSAFIDYIGEDTIKDAYFNGNIPALKTAFVNKRKPVHSGSEELAQKDWTDLLKLSSMWAGLKDFLNTKAMLTGSTKPEIDILNAIEKVFNDIEGVSVRVKSMTEVKWNTDLLIQELRKITNEVYTGKASHDLKPILAQSQLIYTTLSDIAEMIFQLKFKVKLNPDELHEGKNWALKFKSVIESYNPMASVAENFRELSAVGGYLTAIEERLNTLKTRPVTVQEEDDEDVGISW